MANRLYNKQVSPKGYQKGGSVKKDYKLGTKFQGDYKGKSLRGKAKEFVKTAAKQTVGTAKEIGKKFRTKKMGGGMMMKRPMMNGSRTNMKIGGFLKKVGKKVGKAAAGVGAAVLAAKALKKKKPTGKKQDAVDKFFKKKGTTLKTGSAIAAETMAKADRDKKKFRKGLDKIAAAGGVSKLKAGGRALRPVDKEKNPGLAKLPTKVRNKMGFMKKGGKV